MKNRKHARSLLKLKKEGFPSPWRGIIGFSGGHIYRWTVLIILIYALYDTERNTDLWGGLMLGVGVMIGVLLRDFVLFAMVKRRWPLSSYFTNWELVAQVAEVDMEPSSPPPFPESNQ